MIHVLVEGPSEVLFLDLWLKRLLPGTGVKVHGHRGKGALHPPDRPSERHELGLLDQLPAKLMGFNNALDPRRDAVVVLVDADDDEPSALRGQIEQYVGEMGIRVPVLIGLAVEELESFYLGDLRGLAQAYPDADMALASKWKPDSICGTWEYFGDVIGDGGGNKTSWASAMGPQVTTRPAVSRSPSFRAWCAELLELAAAPAPAPPVTKKRWRPPPKRDRHGRR